MILGLLSCEGNSSVDNRVEPRSQGLSDAYTFSDSLFELKIPKDIRPINEVSNSGSFNFQSLFKEQFIRIDIFEKENLTEQFESKSGDQKQTLLKQFSTFEFSSETEALKVVKASDWIELISDSLDVLAKALDAKAYGIPHRMSYWYVYIEGRDHMVQLIFSTPFKKKLQFEEQVNAVVKGFRFR